MCFSEREKEKITNIKKSFKKMKKVIDLEETIWYISSAFNEKAEWSLKTEQKSQFKS